MTRTVHDDLGAQLRVPETPSRLVSLVPNLSEVLWWWHLADRIVGVTDYCVAPPRAFDHALRVRGTKNPDVAAIEALGPDLVVANEEENRPIDVERLREAGIAVYVTKVRTVADAADTFVGLGEAVGVDAPAKQLSAELRRAVEGAARRGPRLRAVCPIWRDGAAKGDSETWWVLGQDTYAADLLRVTGFDVGPTPEEVHGRDDPDRGEDRYPRYRLAELAGIDPDAVLLPDEPYRFTREDAKTFASWRAAVRHLDGAALVWWGPRTPTAIGDLDRLRRGLMRRRRR